MGIVKLLKTRFGVDNASSRASGESAPTVRFVVASRESGENFFKDTALGNCLCHFPVEIRLFEKNTKGLASRYNEAIEEARTSPAILVFVHDDVHFLGYHFVSEIINAVNVFDVAGIVGNKRRVPGQPSWCFLNLNWTWDQPENLNGIYGVGKRSELRMLDSFGTPGQEVKLLDGMMLAAHSRTLIESGIRFDERFDFHFYDLDFCRQLEAKNLRMGTGRISVIHEGGGNYSIGTPEWKEGYSKYLDKWKE